MSERLDRVQDLGEAMALAILKGDRVAAYALADLLIEERNAGGHKMAKVAKEMGAGTHGSAMSHEVYRSPEFQAFCARWGVAWDLRTRHMTIHLPVDGLMSVIQEYIGDAMQPRQEGAGG